MNLIFTNPIIDTQVSVASSVEDARAWVEKYATHSVTLTARCRDTGIEATTGRGSGWYRGCADGWVTGPFGTQFFRDGRWEFPA